MFLIHLNFDNIDNNVNKTPKPIFGIADIKAAQFTNQQNVKFLINM